MKQTVTYKTILAPGYNWPTTPILVQPKQRPTNAPRRAPARFGQNVKVWEYLRANPCSRRKDVIEACDLRSTNPFNKLASDGYIVSPSRGMWSAVGDVRPKSISAAVKGAQPAAVEAIPRKGVNVDYAKLVDRLMQGPLTVVLKEIPAKMHYTLSVRGVTVSRKRKVALVNGVVTTITTLRVI